MDRCPHTWFSTELRGGTRLVRARLQDLLTAPRRRGTLPALLTLLCVATLGSMVACRPDAPTTQTPPPSRFEAVELETLWQQDLGAGVPLPLAPEERADFAALLRTRMDAAYAVLCDCLGYTAAAQAQGDPRYDDQGRAWYPFPKYGSVAEVRAAVDAVFADEHRMDAYLDPDGDPWLRDLDGELWWLEDGYMDGGAFLPPETYCFDSLALLSRTEDRMDFALVGLGNYYDAPLEHFTLVREGDAWKLEDYGEPVVSLTADTLTGGLWLHTMLLWNALDLDAALSEARVERVNRYTDQEGEAGDRFQIYRFYPAYTLSQDPGDALPDALTTDGLTCRPSAAPYLVFLEREGSLVCLGRLPGDAGTPGSNLFTAHRNLLLAQWEAGLSQT